MSVEVKYRVDFLTPVGTWETWCHARTLEDALEHAARGNETDGDTYRVVRVESTVIVLTTTDELDAESAK